MADSLARLEALRQELADREHALAIIFLRQFLHLFTGIGVVLAGVAIALQEVILSFFGFFAIRGARGYRVGDWLRIGDSYGEVVDIGLLVTILEVTPCGVMGNQGEPKPAP